ncbi:excinuclease ABC subunit UvrB [Sodaliphilus sp.]|uniref:excinuclease ABC subunit UvrB n=1 Tax=Sodaliphilus sp. TaxID=2815818 RepID=UPI003890FD3C
MEFKLHSPYSPTGDQPQAIAELSDGVNDGTQFQTLLGVTGSGKTFTMANVIARTGRPTLILSHNKTLAAQLYAEFKSFFPENSVHYFVSYYDYYQPEAYIPSTDKYIEKDLAINDEIERLRLATVTSLLSGRRDIVVVSSVSCLYGMGNPEDLNANAMTISVGDNLGRDELLRNLVNALYSRNDIDMKMGNFRVKGDTVDIYLSNEDFMLRVIFWGNEVESLEILDPLSMLVKETVQSFRIFPATLFATTKERLAGALGAIDVDLGTQVEAFRREERHVEAKRLYERVTYDLEMIREVGYCSGIENYSRYFDGRKPGMRPFCLLDCFPDDFLTIIDESHVTIPQIRAMYGGDQARKTNLVHYGFRLEAALDNRPLRFEEFEAMTKQTIYVSATPADYELTQCEGVVTEQIIRPTGLLDPKIIVRPSQGQIDDLLEEIQVRVEHGERTLVTTLTKRMAEELTDYLASYDIRCAYMHSDVETMDRIQILDDLRAGAIDVLVGVNLLREGLDLPEVSLVAILDADKEGFLRSRRSLTQTAGRAARNLNGLVIMYADNITQSMQQTIDETERRRMLQLKYNEENGITPQAIIKARNAIIGVDTDMVAPEKDGKQHARKYENNVIDSSLLQQHMAAEFDTTSGIVADPVVAYMNKGDIEKTIEVLKQKMVDAAKRMDFLEAAQYRDEIIKLTEKIES